MSDRMPETAEVDWIGPRRPRWCTGARPVHPRETTLAIVDGLLPADVPDESRERRVARIVMWALLVELPYALCVQSDLMPRADVAGVLALFLERGIPDRP